MGDNIWLGVSSYIITLQQMPKIPEHILLEQLKNETRSAYDLLYTEYFPVITGYIKQNSGNTQDAEDIFHDSILVFLQKIRQPDFVLTSSLKTYLYAIARNLWLKNLRKSGQMTLIGDISNHQIPDNSDTPEIDSSYKVDIWLTRITTHCRRLIKAIFYYRVSMESLMQKMGWKNRHTAANQQYKCMQQLRREKSLDN